MIKTLTDETQFALIGKDISQLQKDVSTIAGDLKSIRESGLVTHAQLAEFVKTQTLPLENDIAGMKRIFNLLGAAVALAIIGGLMKLLLK